MAQFTNQARLIYNDTTYLSNIAVGEITESLSVGKTAAVKSYISGDKITYAVNIVNGGTAATGLAFSDNLGAYEFGARTLYPLTYVPNSLIYYVNGAIQPLPAIAGTSPLELTGLSIPANGNAVIVYQAQLNGYAPLGPQGQVTNTVTISGGGLTAPITAEETIRPNTRPDLSISKSVDPVPVAEDGRLTYTFTIMNRGATAIARADNVIVTDTFNPVLSNIAVTFNGAPWAVTTDYTYDGTSGVFSSVAGNITVPAATYTQNPTTGVWSVTPGTSTIVISGNI